MDAGAVPECECAGAELLCVVSWCEVVKLGVGRRADDVMWPLECVDV
jgi:hypothetical protein